MPKRTNLFQKIVTIVHSHMADGASVNESAMLKNSRTGRMREVDVLITSHIAGYEVRVAIEATSGGRPATVEWVERMIGKHNDLPTNKLILVSESGFRPQARELAISHDVLPLSPEDLTGDDPEFHIVNRLRSIWPKVVNVVPEGVKVHVERPDGSKVWFRATPDHTVFTEAGREHKLLEDCLKEMLQNNFSEVVKRLNVGSILETVDIPLNLFFSGPWTAPIGQYSRERLCMRWEEGPNGPEMHYIKRVDLTGKAHVAVCEVPLKHVRLGAAYLAYGQMKLDGYPAVLVASENIQGGKLTIHFGQ